MTHLDSVQEDYSTADEEQRPSQGLRALPLFFYFFSYLCLVFHSSQQPSGQRTLQVSACLRGQHPDAGGVAGLAEDVSIQRVAALVVSFRQKTTTILET